MDTQALIAFLLVGACALYMCRRVYLIVKGKGASACHGCPSGPLGPEDCANSEGCAPDRDTDGLPAKGAR